MNSINEIRNRAILIVVFSLDNKPLSMQFEYFFALKHIPLMIWVEHSINFRSEEYEKLAKRVLELSDSVKDKKSTSSSATASKLPIPCPDKSSFDPVI